MSKVKICGLSRQDDIDAVNHSLPDYIGFVFAESRRKVDAKTAAMLKAGLDKRIKAIGVFVNQDIDYISALFKNGTIDFVQLHGEEDTAYMKRLRKSCDAPILKALRIGAFMPNIPEGADYLLFDTASVHRGGSGKSFDWNILSGYSGIPYFLAGGLDISNVLEAVHLLNPYCVDVSSGVETNGVKDPVKIDEFVRMV